MINEIILIPSYNRAGKVTTFEYLQNGVIIVPKKQEKQYLDYYPRENVYAIQDKKDGSVARKRNAILDLMKVGVFNSCAWIIDDDIQYISHKKSNRQLEGAEALELLEAHRIVQMQTEAIFGGFDYSGDNMKLKDFTPFSRTKVSFGCVCVNTFDKIRYDENLRINEDVDFWLQNMNEKRQVWKDNRYLAFFGNDDGGKDSVIKYDRKERVYYSKKINTKWGYEAMKDTGTSFRFKHSIKGA